MTLTRRFLSLLLAASVAIAVLGAGTAFTQDDKPTAKATQKAKQKKTRKAPRGRLPNHYGKLGLSKDQKTKIYGIQRTYRARLQDLQQQIEDLRQQETIEIQQALSDDQREQLVGLLKEAQERRAARRKARQAQSKN